MLYAEVEPNQKERIILALKKRRPRRRLWGSMINDASALHAADVGVSVESAVEKSPISCCWKKILAFSLKACRKGGGRRPSMSW